MAVDPSIALAVKPVEIADPLQNAYKAQLLKSAMGQNDMNALQQQQLRSTMAQEQGVNSVLGTQSNYLPPDATGVRRLKPEFETQLGGISHEAYGKYHKDINDQAANYYKQRKDQIDTDKSQIDQAKVLRDEALKLNWGTKSAYENAIAADKSPEEATAIAEEASKKLYADAVAINPLLRQYPRKPFNYQEANDAIQTLKTYADSINERRIKDEAKSSRYERVAGDNGNDWYLDKLGQEPPRDSGFKTAPHYASLGAAVGPDGKPKFGVVETHSGKGSVVNGDIAPPDKSGAFSAPRASLMIDLSELEYSLKAIDGLKRQQGASQMFLKEADEKGIASRLSSYMERKMTPTEALSADALYNRVAVAIASAQSGGRAAISDSKINEVKKLIPLEQDPPEVKKYKREQINNIVASIRTHLHETPGGVTVDKKPEVGAQPPNVRGATQAPDAPRPAARVLGADGKWKDEPATEFGNVQSGGSSVTAPKAIQLPAEVRNELQEGQETEFSNGTVWTLENGEPKQLR